MVDQRLKSLVCEEFAKRLVHRAFHILSHSLRFTTVCYTFRAGCSGHRLATIVFNLKKMSPCKLLRLKR
jgi:hypothetical protein